MKSILTKDQVLQIPKLKETMSLREVAIHFGCSREAISYWTRRLRSEGFDVKNQKPTGKRAMKLRD